MASPTNVRFPDAVDKGLADYARRTGARKSTIVVGAVDEWLRMQAFPGIVFVTEVNGERRAALAAGPEVWTVAEAWLQHDRASRTADMVAEAVGLTVVDVERALSYWSAYRDEIDGLINRHHRAQDDALTAWERRRELDAV